MKRLACFLLALILLVMACPAGYAAKKQEAPDTFDPDRVYSSGTVINPRYRKWIKSAPTTNQTFSASGIADATAASPTLYSESDVGRYFRTNFKSRNLSFTFNFSTSQYYTNEDGYANSMNNVFENKFMSTAFIHTGKETEGDYLAWQWRSYDYHYTMDRTGSGYIYRFQVWMTYNDTASDEQKVDSAIYSIISESGASGSDYRKAYRVYKWLCDNIAYDYDRLNRAQYYGDYSQDVLHIWSAYGAAIERQCVCQGYALLYYRLLLHMGIDTRVVTSSTHAFNLVQMESSYYWADSTWDAHYCFAKGERKISNYAYDPEHYQYFLKGTKNFRTSSEHYPERSWTDYNISNYDYISAAEVPMEISATVLELTAKKLSGDRKSETLTAWITDPALASCPIYWRSSNSNVAYVSDAGVVTPNGKGTCYVSACFDANGNHYEISCKVTVIKNDVNVKTIKPNKKKVTIKKGNTFQLTLKLTPANVYNTKVTYKSSDKKIATVSKKGLIKAKKKGTCTITIKASKGGKTATVKVTVK